MIKLLQDNKSIRTGEVLWAGVVAQDPDSATVIVATTGTVQNNQTGDKPKAANFRHPAPARLREGQVADQRPAVRAHDPPEPAAPGVVPRPRLPAPPGGRPGERARETRDAG